MCSVTQGTHPRIHETREGTRFVSPRIQMRASHLHNSAHKVICSFYLKLRDLKYVSVQYFAETLSDMFARQIKMLTCFQRSVNFAQRKNGIKTDISDDNGRWTELREGCVQWCDLALAELKHRIKTLSLSSCPASILAHLC